MESTVFSLLFFRSADFSDPSFEFSCCSTTTGQSGCRRAITFGFCLGTDAFNDNASKNVTVTYFMRYLLYKAYWTSRIPISSNQMSIRVNTDHPYRVSTGISTDRKEPVIDRVFQLVVRFPLPSPVNTVNWAFAFKTKAGSPSIIPPTQATMLFEERFPDVFLIHTAWVELPAVMRIRLGTVARK